MLGVRGSEIALPGGGSVIALPGGGSEIALSGGGFSRTARHSTGAVQWCRVKGSGGWN